LSCDPTCKDGNAIDTLDVINNVEHVVELLAPGSLQVLFRFFIDSLQVLSRFSAGCLLIEI